MSFNVSKITCEVYKLVRTKSIAKGFTIVELLIVIVVIAILAAITIVSYNGIQGRANDTVIKSDLRNIGQQVINYQITNGSIPTTVTQWQGMEAQASRNSYSKRYVSGGTPYNLLLCYVGATSDNWGLIAESTSGNTFIFKKGSVVETISGQLVQSATMCANEGFTGATTFWLYNAGVWRI